jgi:hypothetical protein
LGKLLTSIDMPVWTDLHSRKLAGILGGIMRSLKKVRIVPEPKKDDSK